MEFHSKEEGEEFLINYFKDLIENMKNAKTHEEKVKIFKDFSYPLGLSPEEQYLGNIKVTNIKQYQDIKALVYDFLDYIENNKNIKIFETTYNDMFTIANHNYKFGLIAELISFTVETSPNIQIYLLLNTFRTVFELNLKNIVIILTEYLKINNIQIKNKFPGLSEIETYFKDYPRINEIKNLFRNDIRNPVAHEEWYMNNEIVIRNKDIVTNVNPESIALQINELFFFRVAFFSYILTKYKDKVSKSTITDEQINTLIKNLEDTVKNNKKII